MVMVKGREEKAKESKSQRVKGEERTELSEVREVRKESEEPRGTEETEDIKEQVSQISGVSEVLQGAEETKRQRNRVKEYIKGFFGGVLKEVKKLIRGDLKAILRLRRNMAIVAAVILFILVASAIFTIRQKNEKEKMVQIDGYLAQASAKYSEAVAIIELNKARAREILVDADKDIKAAKDLDSKNERASKLSADISQKLKETEVQENISFKVLSEHNQSVNSLSFSGKKIVGVGGDKIFEVDPDSKTVDETEGLTNATAGFVYDNKAFVLADGKVHKVDLANGEIEKIIEDGEGQDIAVFIGNIYLINISQILKFSPIEGGYADSVDYLDQKIDFTTSSRFAIDGNVWVTNGGKIYKFLRGENQNFEISGLSSVGELSIIYTDADLDTLYVIDRQNSALLVITKDGLYQKAYESKEFARANDLVVNDDESKVYLAVGDKILEAEL